MVYWNGRVVGVTCQAAEGAGNLESAPKYSGGAGMRRETNAHCAHRSLVHTDEQSRQAAKMEAVGRLAGGVAHDFNNLLSVIVGLSDCVLDATPLESSLRADLEEIRRAGVRAAGLTRQLLAFSREEEAAPSSVNLNEVVIAMDPMLRRLLPESLELHLSLAADLRACLVDRGQAEQVLMNLVLNARDAMPDGGRIEVETSNVTLGEGYVAQHPGSRTGQHVALRVTDNGVGMDAATLERAFEAFFTTKPKGVGTGLGLAVVQRVVRESGGSISVSSEPGRGTSFAVHLPAIDDVCRSRPAGAPGHAAVDLRGSETVMVVEDDAQVRQLIRVILERSGYRVLEAGNGDEAEIICRSSGEQAGLLLTDVVLPGLGGRQLAERLTQLQPGLRVLYMSGYTGQAILEQGAGSLGTAFLPKPITRRALLSKVREVLSAPVAAVA